MGDKDELLVDGVLIGPRSDLVEMFRRQLSGEWVFASKTTLGPEDGVGRVIGATRGTPLEPRVRGAVVALLTDQDPKVRAGAVASIDTYARGFDGKSLMDILDSHIALFRGIPAVATGFPDLEWELLRAIAGTRSDAEAVRSRVRTAAVDPVNGVCVLGDLSRTDPDWVVTHAIQITASQADRAIPVLWNIQDPAMRKSFVEALRSEPQDLRRGIATKLDRPIRDPAERERLRQILIG